MQAKTEKFELRAKIGRRKQKRENANKNGKM